MVADDDAHVDGDGLGAAEPPHHARLERAQELGLQLERELADLVEEERAAVARARRRRATLATAPVKAPRSWPNSSDSIMRRRHGAAVDDDERLAARAAGEVQRLGDALLAGAGLALHEHRGVGAGERARGAR